jgi:amino-acid N-acetyltransferase
MKMSASDITFSPATPADVPAIAELLRAAELPDDDFAPHVARFLVARLGGELLGAVGAEVYGTEALLRSLVVTPMHRGRGLGSRLVDELELVAAAWGVESWWLLTTTAEHFFAARGFRVAEREEAPEVIRFTGQFSGGCCRSAVCMTRERKGGP